MEELTIEEKAKRYDDAIEKARRYYDEYKTRDNILYVEDMEDMFPELKESEDEKIKKEIIDYISKATGCKRWITWLEKYYDKPQGKSTLEAINEEKVDNANKVVIEPKFKIGDWIINTITGNVEQIIDITNNEYICSGTLIVSFDNQHLLKKWTIQDAKDGDVLVEKKEERPFIFKGLLDINHPKSPVAYCGIDVGNDFVPLRGSEWWTNREVCPATKEQRNTLMKAMTDAGYTFDFEKKELKKIEQKDIWSEDVEAAIVLLKNIAEEQEEDSCPHNANDLRKAAQYLETCRTQITWKPSDEQINAIKCAINTLRYQLNVGDKRLNSLYEDLKKLKE